MYAGVAAAVLTPVGEGRVALEGVAVKIRFQDLLCEVAMTQTYRNLEPVSIESVYTFPLPLDAVLLELSVTLGDRTLQGAVVEKSTAEARYEEAITDGDAAILLQQAGPGLYTMNVGNLLPGESAVIAFRYAVLHRWQDDSLRFHLPTTLAPRYGDPAQAGLAPHQTPEFSLFGEQAFTLEATATGLLRDALFESPSHPIRQDRSAEATVIRLSGGRAMMDRDFILTIRARTAERASAVFDRDANGYVMLASFHPRFPGAGDASPRSLKLVIDCSGSMGGDSIAQARQALLRILDGLRPQDPFNVVAFGSHHRSLFLQQMPATGQNLDRARTFARRLDADMGSTEMGRALRAAYASRGPNGVPQDVLLVTDGEVWASAQIIHEALASGHRLFTVGVGSAVAEAFVTELAERTGGACELVSPREDMAERIYRHFQRIYHPRAEQVSVYWPARPTRQQPRVLGPVYSGDTVHAFAWFDEPPEGEVTLRVTLGDGGQLTQTVRAVRIAGEGAGQDPARCTIPRLAAHARLNGMGEAPEAAGLAVRYQLLSEWTHYLVVAVRPEGEKADELPVLRKVAHTLAAGWGGTGTVAAHHALADLALSRHDEFLEMPAFLRRSAHLPPTAPPESRSIEAPGCAYDLSDLIEALNAAHPEGQGGGLKVRTLEDLADLGLASDVAALLAELVAQGQDEQCLVIALLHLLAGGSLGKGLTRSARRAIRQAYKRTPQASSVEAELSARLRQLRIAM